MSREATRDADDLHGDSTVALIEIRVRRNGAMSVAGEIHNLPYALAMLDSAKDAVKRHHSRINSGKTIITPSYDAPKFEELKT